MESKVVTLEGSKNIHRKILLRKPMPHMLNLYHPRLLLQQHRPLGIPRQAPIEERCSLFDTEPGMSGERDPEDVAELFEG